MNNNNEDWPIMFFISALILISGYVVVHGIVKMFIAISS